VKHDDEQFMQSDSRNRVYRRLPCPPDLTARISVRPVPRNPELRRYTLSMAESQQTADVSALPIDQQMEQILRTRLDVQELVSRFGIPFTRAVFPLSTRQSCSLARKSPIFRQIAETRFR
jgi:hypothetical protein